MRTSTGHDGLAPRVASIAGNASGRERIFLTQPFGGGRCANGHGRRRCDEARRMAAYLRAQEWEPGSRVAILSKNCAWWIMADLAIWMAGHVTRADLSFAAGRNRCARSWSTAKPRPASSARRTSRKRRDGIPAGVACIAFPPQRRGVRPAWDEPDRRPRPDGRQPARACRTSSPRSSTPPGQRARPRA